MGVYDIIDRIDAEKHARRQPHLAAGPMDPPADRAAVMRHARAYLDAIPPAIEGQGGDEHTFRVCAKLARGFTLSDDEALALLAPWNATCEPPWTERELLAKLESARRNGHEPIGGRLHDPGSANSPNWANSAPGDDEAPSESESARSRVPRLTVYRATDAIALPAPAEVIEGAVWAGCVSVLVSESGAGKTFVVLGTGAAVNAGVPWLGRRTLEGSIVYAGYESDAIGLRLRALRDVQGYDLQHVYVLRAHDPISPILTREGEQRSTGEYQFVEALTTLRDELAAAGLPPIRLIIIDTIRASLAGSEDGSADTSAYLRAVRRILAAVPEAGCLLAHHAGWQDGDTARKRERGSSAWRGCVDATLYLEAGEYDATTGECPLTLRTLKVRDGEKPGPLHLIRRRVEIPGERDRYGRPVTSCVVERDPRSREDREAERAEAAATEQRAVDLRTLRAIVEHPDDSTSQDRLRLRLGGRKTTVSESLSRLIQAGWIIPGKQRQPYLVTPAGRAALESPCE